MVGEESSARARAIALWCGVAVLLVAAFLAALGAVQRTYYSPSGFVTAYVDAVAAHDVQAALAMPGAAPTKAALARAGLPADASKELLRSDVLPRLTGISVVSDAVAPDGTHTVGIRAQADGHPVTADFRVRQTGAALGLLPTWTFATTPLSVARITVAHADDFTIGGHTLDPRAAAPDQPAGAFSVAADYLVLAPARYELGHTSTYVAAQPTELAGRPGSVVEATVEAQPTPAFTSEVQHQLNGFLDQCVAQKVLQPAGCPMGVEIDDRVQGEPTWSMVSYPPVTLNAGPTSWVMPRTGGVAHLSVTVQSLFDGSVEQRESDEPFTVTLTSVVIRPDGSLDIVVGD